MRMKKSIFVAIVLTVGLTACKTTGNGRNDPDGSVATGMAIDEEHFPDAIFRAYLLEQNYGKDGVLTDKEIKGIYKIDLSNRGVKSVKGVEHFYNLGTLIVRGNPLGTLVLPHLERLNMLNCIGCELTELDFNECQGLTTVYCNANKLVKLTVNLPHLLNLEAPHNQLVEVKFGKEDKMRSLDLSENPLKGLDLSNCKGLESVGIKGSKFSAAELNSFIKNLPQAVDYIEPVPADTKPAIVGLAAYRLSPEQKATVKEKGWNIQ